MAKKKSTLEKATAVVADAAASVGKVLGLTGDTAPKKKPARKKPAAKKPAAKPAAAKTTAAKKPAAKKAAPKKPTAKKK